MGLAHSLIVIALNVVPLQGATGEPEIIVLLETGDEARLLEAIRQRPDDVREAFTNLFQLVVHAAQPEGRVQRLVQAERLARLYERAWSDSFFIYSVDRFRRRSAEERAETLEADSLRRAGIEAFYREGPDAAIRFWERSLGQYRALGDMAGQAAALGNLGAAYYAMDRLDRSLRHYNRSLELAEAVRDNRAKGNALGNIANVYKDRGDLARAAEFYGRALEIRPLTGDRRGEAADLNNLGLVRGALGDLRGAEEHFRRALDLNRHDGRARAAANNLTNLANIATKRGRYGDALNLYSDALAVRRETGDRWGETLDLENLGLLHLRWGDYPASLGSLEEALAILVDIGTPIRRAELHSDIAAVHAAMGDLRAALEELDRAEVEAGGDDYLVPALALQRADLLSELNEFDPAAELYNEARVGYERLGDGAGQAEAEHGLGDLYLSRGDYGDYDVAAEALTRALLLQERLDDPRPAALTRVLLGDVHVLRGDTDAARASYRQALATHQTLGDVAAEALTLGALADLDRQNGAAEAAVARYRTALARLDGRPVAPIRWHLKLGLGLALRAQGSLDDAAAELGAAIVEVETVGATLLVEEQRYGYLADKWSAYAELAKTELARGRPRAAFETSERMRARQLADLLARGQTTSGTAESALIRDEQILRRQIAELTRELHATPSGGNALRGPPAVSPETDEVRESLASARAQYQQLLLRLKESRPEYASLVTGSTATVGAVQRLLPDDAVFIEYLVSDDLTIAFVVSKQDVAALELSLNRESLRQLVAFLRGTVKPPAADLDDELWRTPLRRLYRDLIAPLEDAGYLDGQRLLVFAPHAELHYLPFQAFLSSDPSRESFLIESFDVAYVPSASVWVELSQRDRRARGRGLLAMAPRPEALSNSADEVRAISREDPSAVVLLGSRATEARFVELAPAHQILHLASSGVLNRRNPLFSYVRLNPSRDTDGRLEVHEVFGLSLAADLVVLSACQTGLGTGLRRAVPPGDDWVGLVQAFLYSGAQSVVASLWPVDDRATARLMEKFYQGLRDGRSRYRALGDAQRALINEPGHADPFYWAAFLLTGSVE
ncbi:MAG: CHAT domain-containing protein [Gemmatimonadota bacterium]|nr:MAG: CHAT domain-containing protein [Gemmatimonadota bacterium]